MADDLSGHVVVLGGIGWNLVKRLLKDLREMPVSQVEVDGLKTGRDLSNQRARRPRVPAAVGRVSGERPLNCSRTSHCWQECGVPSITSEPSPSATASIVAASSGSVRALTDLNIRERNEAYLAERFPGGSFALLLRVPVEGGRTISPDLEIESNRLYEWSPSKRAKAE